MSVDLDGWSADFSRRLDGPLRQVFPALTDGWADTDVAGLGLYTDADAGALVAAVNSRVNLDRHSAGDPSARTYYRWSPAEWDRSTFTLLDPGVPDPLAQADAELRTVAEQTSEADFGRFRSASWAALLAALGVLADDGFFDRWPRAVRVLSAADGGPPDAEVCRWIARLNNPDDAREFAAYLLDDPVDT